MPRITLDEDKFIIEMLAVSPLANFGVSKERMEAGAVLSAVTIRVKGISFV